MCEFNEDEDVVPLPCNIAHYFHEACVTEWLKTNTSCPLCRKVITAKDFEELGNRLGDANNADNKT